MVQWLRLWASSVGGPGSIPGQETRSHMPQLRIYTPQLRIYTSQLKHPAYHNEDQRSCVLQLRPSTIK